MSESDKPSGTISRTGRILILLGAFLGWMFAGWEMSLLPLSARSVTIGMLQGDAAHTDWVTQARVVLETTDAAPTAADSAAADQLNRVVGEWFARYIAAFLLGAALGGWVFGWLGDHSGRVKAMALSIVWYSGFTGLSYFAQTPLQMCVMRFVACMGIGGMWPAGVALVSEAWPDVSRPTLAGLIGTSANVGIALFSIVVKQIGQISPQYELTPDSWRWVMLLGAVPVVLGVWVYFVVPESPRWLAEQKSTAGKPAAGKFAPLAEVLRPPLLRYTLAGIALGTIPLLGAWGSQKWILPWAGQVGAQIGQASLKADTQTIWAIGAAIGSLCGGWLATIFGRRTTYFVVSLLSLILGQAIFSGLEPSSDWQFMLPVFLLGMIATVYFGWLPLFLPEMFPTRVRATGSGVSFNSGRVISAIVVLTISGFVSALDNDYARIGSITSWVYLAGMLIILIVPKSPESMDEVDAGATDGHR
ncbi:MAG TPA: MFS transporter [Planctomycetes bacterium]|nr:MFS transporter [Fuerstiella sp.]HIK91059.1 MFS transporter [Planctomycetota bacterium]